MELISEEIVITSQFAKVFDVPSAHDVHGLQKVMGPNKVHCRNHRHFTGLHAACLGPHVAIVAPHLACCISRNKLEFMTA